MPDSRDAIDIDAIEHRSRVIAPGYQRFEVRRLERDTGSPIRIGWVSRFETDKRPDRFAELLDRLDQIEVPFELILLGERGRNAVSLDQIRRSFERQILHDGFVKELEDYRSWLGQMDVVVSTADHEFFGIAICEAICAEAVPVVPDGLSYREYVPEGLPLPNP